MNRSVESQQEPLYSFPYFRTNVFDEWYNFMESKKIFSNYITHHTNHFYAFFNSINLGSITLSGIGNKSKFYHTYEYNENNGLIIIQLSGNSIASHCGVKFHSKDYKARTFTPSTLPYYFQSTFPISIFISFPNSILTKTFHHLFGDYKSSVQIKNSPYNGHLNEYLKATIINIANILNNYPGVTNAPLIIAQYEQLIYTTILHCCPNTAGNLSDYHFPPSSSKIVRTVEEYIEANIDQPLRLEDLVSLTGLSIRTIQETFKKHRGYTPSQFLREQRLLLAHKILQESPPDSSILSIALSCGFATHAHFSECYKKRFGVTPLESQKKSRF